MALLLAAVVAPGHAETPEERGLAIATQMRRSDSGWGDQRARLVMILRNRQGQESRRELRVSSLEVAGDGDKSLIVFDHPRDVAGTALLSFTHAVQPDDQWLYLPALKRVRRITSTNKSGPFMGSEFAYEDLTSQELEKYSYRWLRDETLEGRQTRVIERIPAYEHSGYSRQIVWVDQEMWQPLKVQFHDRKDELLKTLSLGDYHQYAGRWWRSLRMDMSNHQSGKHTRLEWSDYVFGTGLSAGDFNQGALRRAR